MGKHKGGQNTGVVCEQNTVARLPKLVQELVEGGVVRAVDVVRHLVQHRAQHVVEVEEAALVARVPQPQQDALRVALPVATAVQTLRRRLARSLASRAAHPEPTIDEREARAGQQRCRCGTRDARYQQVPLLRVELAEHGHRPLSPAQYGLHLGRHRLQKLTRLRVALLTVSKDDARHGVCPEGRQSAT